MPFSIVMNGYPTEAVPVAQVQGPALQGMFLHLLEAVDPDVANRLHDDRTYRPYTLSPLGIGERGRGFRGFRLPRDRRLTAGTPCYLRITLLDDALFPTFSRYFLSRPRPTFRLGQTAFTVTNVLATPEGDNDWSDYRSYAQLIERAARVSLSARRLTLRFLTPTSFRSSDMDLPLPLPRLVFQSYARRFREFCDAPLLPDLAEQVERHTGIARMDRVRTDTIVTNKTVLNGFVGEVTFVVSKKASPELLRQLHLLADFAFFAGTGKKTTVGMGQTVSIKN
jgi:CRISPR-associated endoribonuclease Cas6